MAQRSPFCECESDGDGSPSSRSRSARGREDRPGCCRIVRESAARASGGSPESRRGHSKLGISFLDCRPFFQLISPKGEPMLLRIVAAHRNRVNIHNKHRLTTLLFTTKGDPAPVKNQHHQKESTITHKSYGSITDRPSSSPNSR